MRTARSVFLASVLLTSAAFAQQVPQKVNFTARLVDNGTPVTGSRDFVFKLYPTLVGGSEVWSETRNALNVVEGTVNVDLGASTPLTDTILDGQTLYLEVTVGTQVLTPRSAIISAPYAVRAGVAGRIGALTETDLQRRVTMNCPTGQAIRAVNADGTVVCQVVGDGGVSGGTGTITGVVAGAGILGGGTSGSVNVAVSFAGTGTADTASRSDHTHNFVSSITAGTGLTGGTITSSGTISLAASVPNWASTPTCAAGSAIRTLTVNGTPTCEPIPGPVAAPATGGLVVGTGNNVGITTAGCSAGFTMRYSGTAWGCVQDVTGVAVSGGGLTVTTPNGPTPTVALATTGCAVGQVMKYTSTGWSCQPESITSVGAGAGLAISGPSNAPALSLATTVPNWTAGAPSCGTGTFLRGVAANGTPTCTGPQPADAYFNITAQGASGSFAALWVPCYGASCSIAVPGSYAYGNNSTAQTVNVVRNSAGNYSVPIPWMSVGVPMVTTYSSSPTVSCRVGSWGGTPLTVSVLCYDLAP